MDHLVGLLDAALRDMRSRLAELAGGAAEGHPTCFVALRSGAVVAIDLPAALGAAQELCSALTQWSHWRPEPGDIVVTNDPYLGSAHLQDFTVLVPFWDGGEQPAGYAGVTRHISDIGGDVPGGYNARAEEIWAEGVRVTPIRIYRAGRPDRGALRTLMLNSRRPNDMEKALLAMSEAALAGTVRLAGTVPDGRLPAVAHPGFSPAAAALCDQVRTETSSSLASWLHKEATATSGASVEPLGAAAGTRTDIMIQATVSCSAAGVVVDLTACPPQVRLPINCSRATTVGFALLPLLEALGAHLPDPVGGLAGLVQVRTIPGSVLHARLPAPTAYGVFTVGPAVARATAAALGQLLPAGIQDEMTRRLEQLVAWHPRPVADVLKGGR